MSQAEKRKIDPLAWESDLCDHCGGKKGWHFARLCVPWPDARIVVRNHSRVDANGPGLATTVHETAVIRSDAWVAANPHAPYPHGCYLEGRDRKAEWRYGTSVPKSKNDHQPPKGQKEKKSVFSIGAVKVKDGYVGYIERDYDEEYAWQGDLANPHTNQVDENGTVIKGAYDAACDEARQVLDAAFDSLFDTTAKALKNKVVIE